MRDRWDRWAVALWVTAMVTAAAFWLAVAIVVVHFVRKWW